ncbi:glycerol-3-phosphate acyltransferase [Elstera cyanobacteriorum]|uniref:Glycerol-3-phosphate acyltransferase n=1 Tax=Elstera cyanobacteriorum TaxID=2022747 RepID=A0A255XYJ5_9PROT|nr:glycerol-3-phosphate 1-O-acyltransferase PlsY [Elstera cyanobacteriorum]OYQ22048.1 acyl-phosphate glycerol 3-phosphate acyltransferase [Elstera cyanobacteriorum]GFZ80534.1 glycerol-3-phosphate acyltransferase [Elstera cyanobacteriorum]
MSGLGLWVALAVASYLLGSIPFGLVLTKLAGLGDIRAIGSGNIGATNVLRTGKKGLAAATLLLDGGKGAAAVLLARWLVADELAPLIAGVLAFLGHLYPVWLGFKGGKGVATAIGLWLALAWPVGVGACLLWLLTAFLGRRSSLAALVAIGLTPVLAGVIASVSYALAALPVTLLVFWRHRGNIERLLAGTEPKIGESKQKAENRS